MGFQPKIGPSKRKLSLPLEESDYIASALHFTAAALFQGGQHRSPA